MEAYFWILAILTLFKCLTVSLNSEIVSIFVFHGLFTWFLPSICTTNSKIWSNKSIEKKQWQQCSR